MDLATSYRRKVQVLQGKNNSATNHIRGVPLHQSRLWAKNGHSVLMPPYSTSIVQNILCIDLCKWTRVSYKKESLHTGL